MTLSEALERVAADQAEKLVVSKPAKKTSEYKRIVIEKTERGFQASRYTQTQVFHLNFREDEFVAVCADLIEGSFRQVNAWGKSGEHILLISKDGAVNHKLKRQDSGNALTASGCRSGKQTHNREKNYLIPEGADVPPLYDMGVFTKDGRVVKTMYDKFRQINRFLELIHDEVKKGDFRSLNIIDFGCGKSYLTFVIYYYLTRIMGIEAHIIGLDLKKDVIKKCNDAAAKYGYENLRFEVGDINGYTAPFPVDMVVTLHACDTATDYALASAVAWRAKLIFSVPCCQHELNAQMKTEHFSALSDYGIIKERFSALATDAIRAKLLEASGYKTQLLEFVDFEHTPKNILIRAVRRPVTPASVKQTELKKAEELAEEFHFQPTLYKLLTEETQ